MISPLMEFLEADDHRQRLEVLNRYKENLTEDMLDSMSLSMDCVLTGRDKEEKYYEFEKILRTKFQYEKKPR
jgi:hypothetical protein